MGVRRLRGVLWMVRGRRGCAVNLGGNGGELAVDGQILIAWYMRIRSSLDMLPTI